MFNFEVSKVFAKYLDEVLCDDRFLRETNLITETAAPGFHRSMPIQAGTMAEYY